MQLLIYSVWWVFPIWFSTFHVTEIPCKDHFKERQEAVTYQHPSFHFQKKNTLALNLLQGKQMMDPIYDNKKEFWKTSAHSSMSVPSFARPVITLALPCLSLPCHLPTWEPVLEEAHISEPPRFSTQLSLKVGCPVNMQGKQAGDRVCALFTIIYREAEHLRWRRP